MRLTRRGVIAQNSDAGFIWKIYTVVTGINESIINSTGSFNLSRTRYKMAAKSYTVSSSGTITLTNPTQTTAANLVVGDYLVNISTSNNTSTTSTNYLYKIVDITVSGTTYTISYQRFKVGNNAKGTFTGEQVSADKLTYPVDDIWDGDGRWYELIKGEYVVYVWEQYSLTTGTNYVQVTESDDQRIYGDGSNSFTYNRCETMSFNKTTGKYTLSNQGTATATFASTSGTNPKATLKPSGGYYGSAGSNKSSVFKISSGAGYSGSNGLDLVLSGTLYTAEKEKVAGNLIGTVESIKSDAYPNNAMLGANWYKYSHSYIKAIDNR